MIEVITYDNKLQFAGDISIIMKTIEGNEKNKFRFENFFNQIHQE